IKGKIAYMPLEQLLGKDVDPRADIYALGIILYEMIAGAHPFGEAQSLGYLDRLAKKEPPPPLDDRAAISSHLAEFVATCMASDRYDRFGDSREVVRLLDQHLRDVGANAPEFDLADLMSEILETPAPQTSLAGETSFFDQALGQRLERGESQGGLATFLLASSDVEDDTERSDEAVTREDRRRPGAKPQGDKPRGDETDSLGDDPEDELPALYHPWALWLALGLVIAAAGTTIAWWLLGTAA
ncbi:MAG: protein kinase, partial [Deltaproteobacteria bacterium]|nr:protein kinase [Deltaproteobacteria bacterium]